MAYQTLIDHLLNSQEPSIRYKTMVNVLSRDSGSHEVKKLQLDIKNSARVKSLLSNRDKTGKIVRGRSIYDKWQGAHWSLNTLADIGYPKDDKLIPVRDQVFDFWLAEYFFKEFIATKKSEAYSGTGVPIMQGRYRRCASQQGNALYFLLKLGLADDRVHQLVERLLCWQWPDGGWNCDKDPSASCSSFIHTLWSIRGLALYVNTFNDSKARKALHRAAEVLLSRNLFKRKTNGKIIKSEFLSLHYPLYWHYDILGALKVMAEAGFIRDKRCNEALNILEEKQIGNAGWPAEKKYYRVSRTIELGNDFVDWGGTGKNKTNEWVTVDALYVLKEAGRMV